MSFLIFVGSIHPVLSALRTLRMSHERELISATKNALEASDYTQGSPGGGIVTEALAVVAGRYVGAEGALHAFSKPINFDIAGNYDAYFSRGLLEFSWAFTAEFAGYGYAENYTGGAPSFVGASYMLAGFWGPPIFSFLFVLFFCGISLVNEKLGLIPPRLADPLIVMIAFSEYGEGMVINLPERLLLLSIGLTVLCRIQRIV